MEKITVLMVVCNQKESVKLAVESFRLFNDIVISMVIIDKGSTDELGVWAKEQSDLTYVLLDEANIECGKAFNMVIRELNIDTDFLTMEGIYALTPRFLSRLRSLLHKEKNVEAVGGIVCNNIGTNPYFQDKIQNYREAIELAVDKQDEETKGKYVLMPHNAIVLWKRDILDEIGLFEEKVSGIQAMIDDYCMRTVMANKKVMVCLNAFLWRLDMEGISEEINGCTCYDRNILEKKWGMHYFNGVYNSMLINMIEKDEIERFSVLEIGCDCGATLLEIKNRFHNVEVYGSEINETAVQIASHVADDVIKNNIEDKNLSFPQNKFDYILFGDVLEHLHNPLETLIYCTHFLREGGKIIASIPNVMHISVMEQLLQGDFTYTEVGLLDRTHIHMFTYNEIVHMLDLAGYKICDMKGSYLPIDDRQNELIGKLLSIDNRAQRFMYETFQYIVKAMKS